MRLSQYINSILLSVVLCLWIRNDYFQFGNKYQNDDQSVSLFSKKHMEVIVRID